MKDKEEIIFYFSKDQIKLSEITKDGLMMINLEINTSELISNQYNVEKPEYPVKLNLENLCKLMQLKKKDGFKIFKTGNKNDIFIKLISQDDGNSNVENCSNLTTLPFINNISIDIPEYKRNEPNCIVSLRKFSEMCKSMGKLNCSHIIATGFSRSVNFKSVIENEDIGQGVFFGEVDDDNNSENNKIKMASKYIKKLAKLSNLTPNGIIKIFIEDNKPIKFICPVGNYAKLKIYIKNES
uniref:Proliferating cell nuclear antigen n=1 Tax=Pithovirus LCPAC104 TaxID=2506589 RepID=A0A481Z6A7_9VIRU|nr:MAG: proliferating cell nuclear antigen [Pithovirus LCPAC104]